MADPTITDVFNELVLVNGKLDQIQVNTSLVVNLNASINKGFNDTVNALNTLTQLNIDIVKLIYHKTQQEDAIICILDQISKNTCEILNQVTTQTALQTRLADDVDALLFIAESADPEGALERQRQAKLQAEIERCCPPPEPVPPCQYEPCPRPRPIPEPKLPQIDGKQGDHNPPR